MKTIATLIFALFAGLAAAGGPLATIAEAMKIRIEDIKVPIAFDFTGTIVLQSAAWGKGISCAFSDDTGGISLFADSRPPANLRQWDAVRVKGKMIVADSDKTRRFVAH